MTELVVIKGNRRVKIGDAEQVIVEFSKQGSFRAHVDETPTELTYTDYCCVLTDIHGMPLLEVGRACSWRDGNEPTSRVVFEQSLCVGRHYVDIYGIPQASLLSFMQVFLLPIRRRGHRHTS